MTDELLQELKEYTKDGNIYGFIANHYWELSKEELKDLFLEYAYATYDHTRHNERQLVAIEQQCLKNYLERIE